MGEKGEELPRYRYRTSALAGPWRDSREAALRDAIAARQVRIDDDSPEGMRWIVPGEIEEGETGEELTRRIKRH